MKNTIYPCLWFDGNAKAAAEFYTPLFKNSKIISENPMVVMWELNGTKIMGLNGGPMFKMNPSISFSVTLGAIEEVNKLWEKLLDGGKVMMQLDKYPWSERYGWLQDKFGMTWQISLPYEKDGASKITPSFLFTDKRFGQAEAAVKFYTSVFENSSVDNLIPYGKEDPNAGKLMFSEFELNNYHLIAMDGPGEHKYTFNEAVSLVVPCDNQKEIDYFWNKLTADGGEESMCGWLKDKFGVSWQIIPANIGELMSDPARGGRVMKEVMKMKKLDMAVMENA